MLNPSKFPAAASSSVKEVARRRAFHQVLDSGIKSLNEFIKQECGLRKEFFDEFGSLLPKDFIPNLKS